MPKKIALVHEYFNQLGGAERVVLKLAAMFPGAPIYTLFITPAIKEQLPSPIQTRIKTSFLQRFPVWLLNKRILFPLYPIAIEQFDFHGFDLVISSSSAYAKSIITRPGTRHICYCHSPMRYLWDWYHNYQEEQHLNWFSSQILPYIFNYLRIWDHVSSKRVDTWIANSEHVQKRIKKYYQQDSIVIYPPVPKAQKDLMIKKEKYFLVVSRLSPYKKVELAIETANKHKLPLKIVGTGQMQKQLQRQAGATIEFLGRVSDHALTKLYQQAQALLFLGEEDFGLVMIEALAHGTPVIAYAAGGALEIVQPGINGEFFEKPTPESLITAIHTLTRNNYQRATIVKSIEKFEEKVFEEKIKKIVEKNF